MQGRTHDEILRNDKILENISEIATLVARYNILESMYQQWPGMSLEMNYRTSLIALCVHVLRYLDHALFAGLDSGRQPFSADLEALMVKIREADATCRGFSVTIISVDSNEEVRSKVEDVSADEDDSDSTEVAGEVHGGSTELLPGTLPVSRS